MVFGSFVQREKEFSLNEQLFQNTNSMLIFYVLTLPNLNPQVKAQGV